MFFLTAADTFGCCKLLNQIISDAQWCKDMDSALMQLPRHPSHAIIWKMWKYCRHVETRNTKNHSMIMRHNLVNKVTILNIVASYQLVKKFQGQLTTHCNSFFISLTLALSSFSYMNWWIQIFVLLFLFTARLETLYTFIWCGCSYTSWTRHWEHGNSCSIIIGTLNTSFYHPLTKIYSTTHFLNTYLVINCNMYSLYTVTCCLNTQSHLKTVTCLTNLCQWVTSSFNKLSLKLSEA